MSLASSASLRTLAGSIDGSLGRRVREPIRAANSIMLSRYLADPQRHEKTACAHSTANTMTSPAEDIKEMKKKIRAIIPKASGARSNQSEGR